MKMFNIRKLASILVCLTIATTISYAQSKMPSWVKKTPTPKDAYIGIATAFKPTPMDTIPFNPNYKEETRLSALWKVANQLPWQIDQQASLCAVLSMEGQYKASLNEVLLAEIQSSPIFATYEEWENETEYWCFYCIKISDAQDFVEQMVASTKATGERMYAEAKSLQQQGFLYKAAQKYIETLDSLHPAIFRYLPIETEDGEVDLGRAVYDSYANIYKGIKMTADVSAFPAVYGEEVPGTYAVTVTQHGVPVRNLGIIPEFEGIITAEPTTDENGKCLFSIDNISSKSINQIVGFTIDTDYLLDLPSVYGCNALANYNLFPSLKIPVKLFNPKAFTKIDVAPQDSLLRQSLENIWRSNRNDMVFTERYDSADVLVEYAVSITKEKAIDTDKHHFVLYNANLNVKVKGTADDVLLTEYDIKDFKLLFPASRTEAQVRQSALREMIRQVNRELPSKVEEFKFDKRELVWRSIVSVSNKE